MSYQYRLSWESVPPLFADGMERQYGGSVWKGLNDPEWDGLPWKPPTAVEFTELADRIDQHDQLQQWAESHAQPIRNVKLERREITTEWEVMSS